MREPPWLEPWSCPTSNCSQTTTSRPGPRERARRGEAHHSGADDHDLGVGGRLTRWSLDRVAAGEQVEQLRRARAGATRRSSSRSIRRPRVCSSMPERQLGRTRCELVEHAGCGVELGQHLGGRLSGITYGVE